MPNFEEFLRKQLDDLQERILQEYRRQTAGSKQSEQPHIPHVPVVLEVAPPPPDCFSESAFSSCSGSDDEDGDKSPNSSRKCSAQPAWASPAATVAVPKVARVQSPPGCVSDDDDDDKSDGDKCTGGDDSSSSSSLSDGSDAEPAAPQDRRKPDFPRSGSGGTSSSGKGSKDETQETKGGHLAAPKPSNNRRASAAERFAVLETRGQERQQNQRLMAMRKSIPALTCPSGENADNLLAKIQLAANLHIAGRRISTAATVTNVTRSPVPGAGAAASAPRVITEDSDADKEGLVVPVRASSGLAIPGRADALTNIFVSEAGLGDQNAAATALALMMGQTVPPGLDEVGDDSDPLAVAKIWDITPAPETSPQMQCKRSMSRRDQMEAPTNPEDEAKKKTSRLVIKPGSSENILWDCIGLILIAWDCFFVPLAFFNSNEDNFELAIAMTWLGRFYWTFNIAVSFITGFIDRKGESIHDLKMIAKRYSMTWLPLDVFIVSFDWLEVIFSDSQAGENGRQYTRIGTTLRTLRMVRTVRLLRVARTPLIAGHLVEHIRSEELLLIAHMIKIMVMMLLLAHFLACIWYGVGTLDDSNGWVGSDPAMATAGLAKKYIWSLHWSIAQFMGETIIDSNTLFERSFTCANLFFGFMFSSTCLGSLTTAMTRLQLISSKQSADMSQLRRYLSNKGISGPLKVRVQRNAQHVLQEQKQNMPEDTISLLKLISTPLLIDIHYDIWYDVLRIHPFFECLRETNLSGIKKICHSCLHPQPLSKGDIMFSDLELPTQARMFFVQQGEVEYKKQDDEKKGLKLSRSRHWVCEAVLWATQWRHVGTLRALEESVLIGVNRDKFHELFAHANETSMARYAQSYCQVLQNKEKQELTDIGEVDEDMEDCIAYAFPDSEQALRELEDSPVAPSRSFGMRGERTSIVSSGGRRDSAGGRASILGVGKHRMRLQPPSRRTLLWQQMRQMLGLSKFRSTAMSIKPSEGRNTGVLPTGRRLSQRSS